MKPKLKQVKDTIETEYSLNDNESYCGHGGPGGGPGGKGKISC